MKNMSVFRQIPAIFAGLCLSACAAVAADDLFSVSASLESGTDNSTTILVRFVIREPGHIYKDSISVEAAGIALEQIVVPAGKAIYDELQGRNVEIYDHDVDFKYRVGAAAMNLLALSVKYQGCSDSICFFPKTVRFDLKPGAGVLPAAGQLAHPKQVLSQDWKPLAGKFRQTAQSTGYMKPGKFISFLESAEIEVAVPKDNQADMLAMLDRGSLWLTIVIILVGGLALNLTPCVLPMIPVNIAIIGAGAQAGSRRRGFALGAVYGCGMALAYGALGAAFVLTGARFGSLQSLPAFNLAICALFLVLALGMFDAIAIDFSRLQSGSRNPASGKQGFVVVLVMGMISALLAGACVAPVVIAVLVYSANLYSSGHAIGLAAPFLLGAGMALPWPFAGAGLSFLPKPGRWMTGVKYVFGVMILVLSAYYGIQGIKLIRSAHGTGSDDKWLSSLHEAFVLSEENNKPVLVDFYADWCRDCVTMDETTFRDPLVQEEMSRFVKARFTANDPMDPAVKEVLDYFKVFGPPTYVVLKPMD